MISELVAIQRLFFSSFLFEFNSRFITSQKTLMKSEILFFALIQIILSDHSIKWERHNEIKWAWACNFPMKDFSNAKTGVISCRGLCAATTGCTHFTWIKRSKNNPYQFVEMEASGIGLCSMKSGSVRRSDAFYTNNYNMVCGIVAEGKASIILGSCPNNTVYLIVWLCHLRWENRLEA